MAVPEFFIPFRRSLVLLPALAAEWLTRYCLPWPDVDHLHGAFVWAVRKEQFDDMDTPALDILRDDSRPDSPPAGRDVPGKDVVPDGD